MTSPKLSPPDGAKKKRKRVGRGRSSGMGKTSGRGTKGQGSRSGSKKRAWFEGGQMPLARRLPKVGFTPYKRTVYQVVNLGTLDGCEAGSTLSPAELAEQGWIKDGDGLVKILGDGEPAGALHVSAHKFSQSAKEKIEKAGGSVTVIPRHTPKAEAAAE